MKWLVTAFEPFDGAAGNASLIVASELSKLDWQDQVRFFYPVPVRFDRAWHCVQEAAYAFSDLGGIVALGQAESRSCISLERVALNWIDARIPDNAGNQPAQGKVTAGPDMYWSNIPWANFSAPEVCTLSYSAGTFVCNALMYEVMDWAHRHKKYGGFIHLPLLQSQNEPKFAKAARMDDATVIAACCEILKFLVQLK